MISVGDVRFEVIDAVGLLKKGKVVFVHPKKRFYTLEFEFENGRKIKESYFMNVEDR